MGDSSKYFLEKGLSVGTVKVQKEFVLLSEYRSECS